MPEKPEQNKKIIWLIITAAIIVVAAAIIAFALMRDPQNEQDNQDAASYVGLTLSEAREKAEDGGIAYRTYLESDRDLIGGQDVGGLILYVNSMGEDGKVVDAELRSPQPEPEQPGTDEENEAAAETYVGLAEAKATQQAEANGLEVRVIARDGELFPITADLKENRINFSITDGKVTKAEFY
jgi:PAS domain-containing protein